MTKLLAGLPKPDVAGRNLSELVCFTNPFCVGDALTVQFGSRQSFIVAALSATRCLMRWPNLNAAVWYTVDDLLRWNPERAPKPAAAPAAHSGLALPVPLPIYERGHIRTDQKYLAAGDVLNTDGRGLFVILHIEPVQGYVWNVRVSDTYYLAQCMRLNTRQVFTCRFLPGASYESVLGGPKITQSKQNPALVRDIKPWPVWAGESAVAI